MRWTSDAGITVLAIATNETDTDAAAERGTSRGRSPNYPALTFTEALTRAEALYKAERRAPVSPDVAAQHWGYSKMNGSSFPIMGALKRYGLVEAVGKDVRISDDAHFILCHDPADPDRVKRVAKLAMTPDVFGEILAKYPELPSERSLIAKLQTEWKFLEPAAKLIVPALADAIRLRDAALALDSPPVDSVTESGKEPTVTQSTARPMSPPMSPPPTPTGMVPMPPTPPWLPGFAFPAGTRPVPPQVREWILGPDVAMTVTIPPVLLTAKHIAKIKKYVAALEVEAAVNWGDEDEEDAS